MEGGGRRGRLDRWLQRHVGRGPLRRRRSRGRIRTEAVKSTRRGEENCCRPALTELDSDWRTRDAPRVADLDAAVAHTGAELARIDAAPTGGGGTALGGERGGGASVGAHGRRDRWSVRARGGAARERDRRAEQGDRYSQVGAVGPVDGRGDSAHPGARRVGAGDWLGSGFGRGARAAGAEVEGRGGGPRGRHRRCSCDLRRRADPERRSAGGARG